MKISFHKSVRAFTLLEIMVALALLAVIVGAIYACWAGILRGSKVALNAAAAAQRSRISIQTLHDSLLCACMFTQNGRYYGFLGDADGDYSELSFVARLPKSFPRSGKFGSLDLRRISYTVETGTDGNKQLVLRQSPLLMEPDKDEINFPLILAKDVNKFIVEYMNFNTGDWDKEWDNTNQLPVEIRIQLALGHSEQNPSEPQVYMVSGVFPPGQAIPLAWQMPGGPAGAPPPPAPGQTPGSTTPGVNPTTPGATPLTPTLGNGGGQGSVFGFGQQQP